MKTLASRALSVLALVLAGSLNALLATAAEAASTAVTKAVRATTSTNNGHANSTATNVAHGTKASSARVLVPTYDSVEKIRAMPPCRAFVVKVGPCYVRLETAEGANFNLGSPGSKQEVGRFLGTLKKGQTYQFPDAFVAYQKQIERR